MEFGFSFQPALNSSMRRRPVENCVQNSRSFFSNPRLFTPKPRRLGGATERHKLKKSVKNQKKLNEIRDQPKSQAKKTSNNQLSSKKMMQ